MVALEMKWDDWLNAYFDRFEPAFTDDAKKPIKAFYDVAVRVRERGGKLMLAGNGASASIASHGAVDFTKQAKVRAVDFNEPNLITAFSNDYGFENWLSRAVQAYADPGDALVLISVSGASPNVVNAAKSGRELGLTVVTFTGKGVENPLKQLGDVNFHMPSNAYNVVEAVHMLWLTTVVDMVVGQAEYSVTD